MPKLNETKVLPYSSKTMFELVMDIEKYPEFLPWCKQAKIVNKISQNHIHADLMVNFKGFYEKYRSDVKSHTDSHGNYFIETKAISGPFKNLVSTWKINDLNKFVNSPQIIEIITQNKNLQGLQKIENICEINFFIDFTFNSFLLEKMIAVIFEKASHKMINSFEDRASKI